MTRTITIVALALAMMCVNAAAQDFGAFSLVKKTDAITDKDRSFIYSPATETINNRVANLAWTCMQDGLNVLYVYGKYLMGSDDSISVQYRFDALPAASSRRWDIATTHRGAFLPVGRVREFTQEALIAQKVVLRVIDRDGDVLTDTVSLNGLRDALRQLPCYRPTDS